MMTLVLLEVSLMNLILGISWEIKWKVQALMDNNFIIAFLRNLQKLHILEQFICTGDPLHKDGVVDNPVREDSTFSRLVEIQAICSKNYKDVFANLRRFGYSDEETKKLPDDKICQQYSFLYLSIYMLIALQYD